MPHYRSWKMTNLPSSSLTSLQAQNNHSKQSRWMLQATYSPWRRHLYSPFNLNRYIACVGVPTCSCTNQECLWFVFPNMCTWVEISTQMPPIPQGLLQTLVDQLTDSNLLRLWRTGSRCAAVTPNEDDSTDVSYSLPAYKCS